MRGRGERLIGNSFIRGYHCYQRTLHTQQNHLSKSYVWCRWILGQPTELQIKGGIEDNLKINFAYSSTDGVTTYIYVEAKWF